MVFPQKFLVWFLCGKILFFIDIFEKIAYNNICMYIDNSKEI